MSFFFFFHSADTTIRNIGIAAAFSVLGAAVGLLTMWFCMKRKLKKTKDLSMLFFCSMLQAV